MKQSFQKYAPLLLFSLPLLIYWVNFIFITRSQNYFINDPEFAYFMNSLGVFKGLSFSYYDHPGTPLAVLGTILLALTYPFFAGAPGGFVAYNLQHYWIFMNLAHYLVVLLHIAAICLIFTRLQKSTPDQTPLLSGMLAVMYFSLHSFSMTATLLWEHNAFSFPFGAPLLLGLYLTLVEKSEKYIPAKNLILLGLGAGFMASVTIYMGAWFIGIFTTFFLFFILQKYPLKQAVMDLAILCFSGITGFILGILPIVTKIGKFSAWAISILTHQSNYLAVPKDESRAVRMFNNLKYIYEILPLLVMISIALLLIGLAATLIALKNKDKLTQGLIAMTWGISFQLVLITLIFLDRPVRSFYLLSLAAMLPFLALPILELLVVKPSARKGLSFLLIAVTLFGLVNSAIKGFSYKQYEISALAKSATIVEQSRQEYARVTGKKPSDLIVLWTGGTYSPCWRLWYGNRRSDNGFANEVANQCPNQYEFAGRVWLPHSKIPLEEAKWDIIFTCEQLVDKVTAKDQTISLESHPEVEWGCGKMVVIYNK